MVDMGPIFTSISHELYTKGCSSTSIVLKEHTSYGEGINFIFPVHGQAYPRQDYFAGVKLVKLPVTSIVRDGSAQFPVVRAEHRTVEALVIATRHQHGIAAAAAAAVCSDTDSRGSTWSPPLPAKVGLGGSPRHQLHSPHHVTRC